MCVAYSCLVLATKIHESRPLSWTNFKSVCELQDLNNVEKSILSSIGCSIQSQGTPISFVDHLLEVLPEFSNANKDGIRVVCSEAMGQFYCSADSLRFSSVTIAIAALSLVLHSNNSQKHTQCLRSWRSILPSVCFTGRDDHGNLVFSKSNSSFLDERMCVMHMRPYFARMFASPSDVAPSTSVSQTPSAYSPQHSTSSESSLSSARGGSSPSSDETPTKGLGRSSPTAVNDLVEVGI